MAINYDPLGQGNTQEVTLGQQVAPPGQGLTNDEESFLLDQIGAYEDRLGTGNAPMGFFSGLSGFRFPDHVGQQEIHTLVSMSEQFAADAGWAMMPSAAAVMSLANYGITDYATAARVWSNYLPRYVLEANPWIYAGLDKATWTNKFQQINSTVAEYLGPGKDWSTAGLDDNVRNNAIANNWSTEQMLNYLKAHPGVQQGYGWVKHGLTYSQFQQSLLDNKQQLESRYGTGQATEQNAVNALDNPLNRFTTGGGGQGVQYQTQNNPAMAQTSSVR